MIVPDVNLLLYAYDNTSPFHTTSRAWWEACLSGSEPVGLTHPVLFAFLRVGTSARAFERPMTLEDASAQVTRWINRRVTRVLAPDANHVQQVIQLLSEARSAGGNLVTDAQVAAIAIAHDATVHTADRDFMRFRRLSTRYPLDKSV
jgi:hypothetical protein